MDPDQNATLKSRALHKELGISPREQPANAYRLLGLSDFEADPEVIQAAYYRRMDLLKQVKSGEFYDIVQGVIVNEVTQAYKRLIKPESNAQYKAAIEKERAAAQPVVPATPIPMAQPIVQAIPMGVPAIPGQGTIKNPPRRTQPTPLAAVEENPFSSLPSELMPAIRVPSSVAKKKQSQTLIWLGLAGLIVACIVMTIFLGDKDQPSETAKTKPAPKKQIDSLPPEPVASDTTGNPADVPMAIAKGTEEDPESLSSGQPTTAGPRPTIEPLSAEMLSRIDTQGVDVLRLIQARRDRIRGSWKDDAGVLTASGGDQYYLQVPYDLPSSYAVKIVARNVQGKRIINSWVMEGKTFLSVLSLENMFGGLSRVDLKQADENETKAVLPDMTDGNVTLYATVTPTKFTLQFNGVPIIAWDQGPERLSLNPEWRTPHANRLSFGIENGHAEYTEFKILPLVDKPEPEVAATSESVDQRKPVPTAAEVASIRDQVREILKDDFTRSIRHEILAEKLLAMSQEEKDPARRYTLLGESRMLASNIGNFELALQAAEQTIREYQLEPDETLLTFLRTFPQLQKNVTLAKPQWHKLALVAIDKAQEQLTQENGELAKKFLDLGLVAATRGGVPSLLKRLPGAVTEFDDFLKLAETGRKAAEALAAMPDDPTTNLQAGIYTAVLKNQLPEAYPLLAKSDHEGWRKLAELGAMPRESLNHLQLGEAWQALSQSDNKACEYFCLTQARDLYTAALATQSGFTKVALEKRIADLEPKLAESLLLINGHLPHFPTGPKEIYLGDMPLLEAKTWQHGSLRSKETVGQVLHQHGLFVHPADNTSSLLAFDLGGNYRTLAGAIGMGDTGWVPATKLTWRVVGDGRELWNSGEIKKNHWKSPPFEINVRGVRRLELFCDCPGRNTSARAFWLDPKVSR